MKNIFLFIGFFLSCLFFSESSFANIDRCMKKDQATDTWTEINSSLCSIPSWAVTVLGDIWNFNYDQTESHFARVKDLYFTEQGWKEFLVVLEKFEILQILAQYKYSVSNIKLSKEAIVHEKDIKEDKASAQITLPIQLMYGPIIGDELSVKDVDPIMMKIKVLGLRDHNKKLKPDSPREDHETWQFDYKIESFKAEPY